MADTIAEAERLYTLRDADTHAVMYGLENVPRHNGNLMRAELADGETRPISDLAVGEVTRIKGGLVVIRER